MGAVLVDKDAPGLSFGPQEELMGFRGIGSADIVLEDVRVPVTDVIVPEGGFRNLFTAFSIERLGNSTMSLAVGQTALDRTARYVQERTQFGKAIVEFQTVHSALADMIVQVEAARLLIYRAAANAGTGVPSPLEASVAKCFSNEMAKKVSDLAMQLHGGYGYAAEYEVERLHRDAHGWALAGGTPAIQRTRIASEYLGRRFDQRG
jgi:butyryl-CoA dehydrogenase